MQSTRFIRNIDMFFQLVRRHMPVLFCKTNASGAKYDRRLADIEILKGSMDDVFFGVTGKNIRLSGGEDAID